MNSPAPKLIGYFARRPRPRSEDLRALPPQIEELCNVGHMNDGAPERWVDLWLHNRLWVYSTEAQAWGVAVDNDNLRRVYHETANRRDGVCGSVQRIMDEHIARHVPPPEVSFSTENSRFHWDLFAYRMFPVRIAEGVEKHYEIDPGGLEPVQPLPEDYVWLGLDLVNRECDNLFECSPLNCNGWYSRVPVNRYCLLDQFEMARQLACHWSKGEYREDGGYVGPAEPGPYFIVEVLRKRLIAQRL